MEPSPTPSRSDPRASLDQPAIAALVERFYARVRQDPLLGPVFAASIAEHEWPAHLARIRGFWSSVMLGSGGYKGDPLGTHLRVEGISPDLFERWLALFGETCRELFAPDLASAFELKAARIADSLKAGLFFRPERVAPPPRPGRL